MAFPTQRLRRTRRTAALRGLVRETRLSPQDFIYPMFVTVGEDVRSPVGSMPGVFQLSINHAVEEARRAHDLGIPGVLLFGIPAEKDEAGSGAYDPEGIVQLATRAIKDAVPEMLVVTDVCLCEYTSHGHCGVVEKNTGQVLDVVRRVRETTDLPVAAYSVSGEYAMIKAAAQNGWLDEERAVLEALTGIKRAGADVIVTYFAPDVARWLS